MTQGSWAFDPTCKVCGTILIDGECPELLRAQAVAAQGDGQHSVECHARGDIMKQAEYHEAMTIMYDHEEAA